MQGYRNSRVRQVKFVGLNLYFYILFDCLKKLSHWILLQGLSSYEFFLIRMKNNDKNTATITSSSGDASGKP